MSSDILNPILEPVADDEVQIVDADTVNDFLVGQVHTRIEGTAIQDAANRGINQHGIGIIVADREEVPRSSTVEGSRAPLLEAATVKMVMSLTMAERVGLRG